MFLTALAVLLLGPMAAAEAGEQPETSGSRDVVALVEVSGLLDPILVDFISTTIDAAEDDDVVALVLQLNSPGAVVSDRRLDALVEQMQTATVPVDVWIGPSGSQASGGATRLVAAADVSGIAEGSRIEVTRELVGDRPLRGKVAVGEKIGREEALESGLVDIDAPVIGDFVISLDGVRTETIDINGRPQRQPITQVRFAQLPLTSQLLHTVASPAVAYLLFIIGLALLVFEFFTAGVGIAGVIGAGSLVLGSYGLAALPARPVAVAALVFAMFAFAVDVQVGAPRVWTGVATVALVLGSTFLYDGVSMPWITLLVGIVAVMFAMLSGMPAMVRARFSTPTIGREWMVGEIGTAMADVAPEGVVLIRDAPWRARTNRATPIKAGEPVRVASIEGLVLEVEPEAGEARDYREARRSHSPK